ncbi:hypothetical protein EDD16DRAFT_1792961 [Pisolithus croceorrhizus]|nr:hypothetical protein EDD16DRAFT_1792961 [Pisolithus croceorrhizus]
MALQTPSTLRMNFDEKVQAESKLVRSNAWLKPPKGRGGLNCQHPGLHPHRAKLPRLGCDLPQASTANKSSITHQCLSIIPSSDITTRFHVTRLHGRCGQLATAPLSQPNGPWPYKVTSTQPSGVREYPHGSRHVSNHKFGFANCCQSPMYCAKSSRVPGEDTLSRGGVLDSTAIMGAVQQTILYFKNFSSALPSIQETYATRSQRGTRTIDWFGIDTKMRQPPPAGYTYDSELYTRSFTLIWDSEVEPMAIIVLYENSEAWGLNAGSSSRCIRTRIKVPATRPTAQSRSTCDNTLAES